jgi:flavorubredoxin
LINKELEAMKLEVIDPGLKIQYVQNEQGMDTCACRELGKKIAQALQLRGIIGRKNGT